MSDCWPKIWGTNTEIYHNDLSSINVLHVLKGGTCSLHTHKAKHNIFHVISGKLNIHTDMGDSTILPGQSFMVLAGTKHQFQAIEETVAIEVMFVRYDPEDIRRESVGYLNKDIELRVVDTENTQDTPKSLDESMSDKCSRYWGGSMG